MRTTVDLPDDVHRIAKAIARDQGMTLSQAITVLVRRAVGHGGSSDVRRDGRTGLPSVRLGVTITTDDVRSADDEP